MNTHDLSDWEKINALRDSDAQDNAHADPDNQPTDASFWADADLFAPEPQKIPIHIRISPDILEFFKKDGPGYQTRIHRVLEHYVTQQQRT
jgi:uncharacterized protein (DUF4415 family)